MFDDGPPGGWERFVRERWERAPAHFVGGADSLTFVSEPELFAIDARAAAGPTRRFRLFVGGAHHQRRLDPFLPRDEDGSFERWAARASSAASGAEVTLLLHEAQAYDAPLFARLVRFLDGLHRALGVCLATEATLYASRAGRTAFGVHQDEYGNFLFIAHGRKRFHLWPEEALRDRPELHDGVDYASALDEATTIEAAAGDLVYVPAKMWHVAESDGTAVHLSLLLNLLPDEVHEFVAARAAELARRGVDVAALDPMIPASAGVAPFAASVRAYQQVGERLGRAVEEAWARRRSARGFREVPDLDGAAQLSLADRVAGDPAWPIESVRDGAALALFARGHRLDFAAHPRVLALVERLNRGGEEEVARLVEEHAGDGDVDGEPVLLDPRAVLGLLRELAAMRGIRRIEAR